MRDVVTERRLLRPARPNGVRRCCARSASFPRDDARSRRSAYCCRNCRAHRLHGVVEVAIGAPIRLQFPSLALASACGGRSSRCWHDGAHQRIADLYGDGFGARVDRGRQITADVLAAEMGPAARLIAASTVPGAAPRGLAAQHAAAEFEFGITKTLDRYGAIACDVKTQVRLPLIGLETAHSRRLKGDTESSTPAFSCASPTSQ